MKRYMVKTGAAPNGKLGYALEPVPSPASQSVSRQDIIDLRQALTWPPEEMRDVNIVEMDKQRKALNSVWEDPNIDPTTKLMKASLHSQLFALANKKHFSKGEPGSSYLPPSYRGIDPRTPAQETRDAAEEATPGDKKHTHSLIPRYRGTPLSVDRSLVHVPPHLKVMGRDMAMTLKADKSPISWDSEGKVIDKTQGVRGQGKVLKGANIQELLGYATSPSALSQPPKGYDLFRSALIEAGVEHLLSKRSETLYTHSLQRKRTKSVLKKNQAILTPPTTLKTGKKRLGGPGETPIAASTFKQIRSRLSN